MGSGVRASAGTPMRNSGYIAAIRWYKQCPHTRPWGQVVQVHPLTLLNKSGFESTLQKTFRFLVHLLLLANLDDIEIY